MNKIELCNEVQFLFPQKSKPLINHIQSLDKDELGTLMKIKGKTLETTYLYYQSFEFGSPAIDLYNGMVFKQVSYNDTSYLSEQVYILSALYGIVNALDNIGPYRLDFTMNKLFDFNLYSYWEKEVNDFINSRTNGKILNLASKEFTKLINLDIQNERFINLAFTEKKNSAILKKVRGRILNYCIDKEIYDYSELVGYEDEIFKIKIFKNNSLIVDFK